MLLKKQTLIESNLLNSNEEKKIENMALNIPHF